MDHLNRKPTVPLLLLGPKNSGKSALLSSIIKQEKPQDKATDLMAVIDTYNFLLENIPPGQKKPIIVIDEANALTLWKRKDAVALKQLLEFFKRSCKEIHTAHIVLATSEFFLVSWLESQGFDENYKSWDEGVRAIMSRPSLAVTKALEFPELIDPPVGSAGPRIWEAKQYKAVLRLIAANPYHAVRRKEFSLSLKV
ncbi:hypothetical protein Ndes2526A_g06662 [Nannochloris sp. 'desiccata']